MFRAMTKGTCHEALTRRSKTELRYLLEWKLRATTHWVKPNGSMKGGKGGRHFLAMVAQVG